MVRPSIFFETEKLQRNKIFLNDLIMGHSSNSVLITPGCILKQHCALKIPNYLVVKYYVCLSFSLQPYIFEGFLVSTNNCMHGAIAVPRFSYRLID